MINKSFLFSKNILFPKLYFSKFINKNLFKSQLYNSNIIFKSFSTKEQNQTLTLKEENLQKLSTFNYLTMNSIHDNKGARILRTRVGRGPGSKLGKTSGRGHKGYKARTGNPHRHFEGGQISKSRRLPKHGFRRKGAKLNISYINIDKIVYLINKNKLNPELPITVKEILYSGGVSKVKDGIKLLGRGLHLLKETKEDGSKFPPLTFEVNDATKEVIDGIKELGGKVIVKYQTPLIIKSITKPWKFDREPIVPYPKFKAVKRMMNIEDKGAEYDNQFKIGLIIKCLCG